MHTCTHTSHVMHMHYYAVPPTYMTHPQAIVDATEWTQVILNCSASGTPVPTIRWEREGSRGAQLPVGAVPSDTTSGNIASITMIKNCRCSC